MSLPASGVTMSGVTPNSKSNCVAASSSGAGRPPVGRSAVGAVGGTGSGEARPPAERVAAEPSVEADLELEQVPTDSEKEVAVPCRILRGVCTGVATFGISPSARSVWLCPRR